MAPKDRRKRQSADPNKAPSSHGSGLTLPEPRPRQHGNEIPPDTLAGVPVSVPAGVVADVPAGVVADVPAGVVADVPAGVSTNVPAGVPHSVPGPAPVTAKAPRPARKTKATTSKSKGLKIPPHHLPPEEPKKLSCWKSFLKCLYDREKGLYCGRTCKSWMYIVAYSIMYFIFLTTYMLIFLYITLAIVKANTNYVDKTSTLTYSEYGIGLTATPTSESSYPLIWYRDGEEEDYKKYIKSIDKLLLSRKSRDADKSLGQCGRPPYGYGSAPCVIVRINKQFKWKGKALSANSSVAANAPKAVKDWLRSGRRMLWLHCGGYHPYDKEHIGRISYYPDPPGFDPELFPLDAQSDAPLVAVQFTSFTQGVSLAVECKLWYEHGPSSVQFVIYVEPRVKAQISNDYL